MSAERESDSTASYPRAGIGRITGIIRLVTEGLYASVTLTNQIAYASGWQTSNMQLQERKNSLKTKHPLFTIYFVITSNYSQWCF